MTYVPIILGIDNFIIWYVREQDNSVSTSQLSKPVVTFFQSAESIDTGDYTSTFES